MENANTSTSKPHLPSEDTPTSKTRIIVRRTFGCLDFMDLYTDYVADRIRSKRENPK